MTVIALIPTPAFSVRTEPETTFKILQTFGRDTIIVNDRIAAGGIVSILDCSKEELWEKHPDAWITFNPMAGRWYAKPTPEVLPVAHVHKSKPRFIGARQLKRLRTMDRGSIPE